MNRLTEERANDADSTTMANGYVATYTYDLAGNRTYREITVENSSGVHSLHTKYTYDPHTDRLLEEQYSDTLITMAIPTDNERVYAYADGSGGIGYKSEDGQPIGSFEAFLRGLPSRWGRYAFAGASAVLALTILLLAFPALLARLRSTSSSRSCLRTGQSG